MTKIFDIINWMNEKFPPETACSWDNSGVLVGSAEGDTDSVVLALDITSKTINKAIDYNSKLIITHHPMIFGGINSVTTDNPSGRLIGNLLRNDITCMAAHTNLDVNHEYSNGILATILGADEYQTVDGVECGVMCEIDSTTVGSFMNTVVKSLNSSGAISINDKSNKVNKLWVQGGSFDEDAIPVLISNGIDTVVSGEIKYHITVLLEEYGINTIIAGHNATERVFMTNLAHEMQKNFPGLNIFVDNGNETNII